MVDQHFCACPPGEPCGCGRPRGRQTPQQQSTARSRLAQLEQATATEPAWRPGADDWAAVSDTRLSGREGGQAGRLIMEWRNRGWDPDCPPQKTRSSYATGGLGGGQRGAA
jgi:hypothetical protein